MKIKDVDLTGVDFGGYAEKIDEIQIPGGSIDNWNAFNFLRRSVTPELVNLKLIKVTLLKAVILVPPEKILLNM